MRWICRASAAVLVASLLVACGDSARSSAPDGAASLAAGGSTTTLWPEPSTTTTTQPNNGGRRASPPQPPASTVVCNRLSGAQLEAALGVSFPSASGTDTRCVFHGSDSSAIQLVIEAVSGSPAGALAASQAACDPATAQPVQAGEGAYTCVAHDLALGAVVAGGALMRLLTIDRGSLATNRLRDGFARLLGDLAPS